MDYIHDVRNLRRAHRAFEPAKPYQRISSEPNSSSKRSEMRKISRRQGLGSEEPGSPFGSQTITIWSPAHTFWAPLTVLTLWSGLVHPQLVIMQRSHVLLASPWFALVASIASVPSCTVELIENPTFPRVSLQIAPKPL